MLLKFFGCMILAAILEFVLWFVIVNFFEWRFKKKSNSIVMLYDSIYPMIAENFNNDKSLKVSIKFQYFGSKVKFRNALEASLKIELLIHKALKDYYIVKFLVEEFSENLMPDFENWEIVDCKEQLEEACREIRKLRNNHGQEGQKKEL